MSEAPTQPPFAELPREPVAEYPGGSYEAFEALVLQAVPEAYADVAAEKGVDIRHIPTGFHCGSVSRALHDRLAGQVPTQFKGIPWLQWASHYHLNTGTGTPEPVIIGAAWQQFLDEPNPDAPDVMIVPAARLEEKLRELGVPEDRHYLWLESVPMRRPAARAYE